MDSAVPNMQAMQPIGSAVLSALVGVEYSTRYLADARLAYLPDDALRLWIHATGAAFRVGDPGFIAYDDVLEIAPSLDALQRLLSEELWLSKPGGYDAPDASEALRSDDVLYPPAPASAADISLIRDRLFAVVPELGQQLAPAVELSAQEGPHKSSRRADGVTRAN